MSGRLEKDYWGFIYEDHVFSYKFSYIYIYDIKRWRKSNWRRLVQCHSYPSQFSPSIYHLRFQGTADGTRRRRRIPTIKPSPPRPSPNFLLPLTIFVSSELRLVLGIGGGHRKRSRPTKRTFLLRVRSFAAGIFREPQILRFWLLPSIYGLDWGLRKHLARSVHSMIFPRSAFSGLGRL